MKKVTISISYDEEKLSALKLYLDQKQYINKMLPQYYFFLHLLFPK